MSNALLVTAVYVKMILGDNTLNNERLPTCKDETCNKKLAYCSPSFITIQYISNRETKKSHKRTVYL